jgi:hypothetical protein
VNYRGEIKGAPLKNLTERVKGLNRLILLLSSRESRDTAPFNSLAPISGIICHKLQEPIYLDLIIVVFLHKFVTSFKGNDLYLNKINLV